MHCIVALSLLVAAPTEETPTQRVLIMQIAAVETSESLGERMGEALAASLAARDFNVATSADVKDFLELRAAAQATGTDESRFATDTADAIDADLVISGSIGAVGGELVVGLTLTDAVAKRTINTVSSSADSEDEVLTLAPILVARLLGFEDVAGAEQPRFTLPEGKKIALAVPELRALGVSQETAASLTQVLAGAIKEIDNTSVVSSEDMKAMLDLEAQKQQLGCSDMACLAEIAGALGVDKMVAGNVGTLSDRYVVSLRLIDSKNARVDNRLTESFQGSKEQLIGAVRHAARRLLGVEPTVPGSLMLSASESDATLLLDDKERGTLPMPAVTDLLPGRYRVRVAKDGYFDWQSEIYVQPGESTPVWAELQEEPDKWYQTWWFWSAVGVVAVGATTIYVVNATSIPDTQLGSIDLND